MAAGGYRERFFSEPLAPDLKRVMETERARRLHPDYHRVDKAHVVMLLECGLIPEGAGRQLLLALRELESDDVTEAREAAGGGAHAGEQHVTSRLGEEIGGYIHLGRSTGDLTATATRLGLRRRLVDVMAEMLRTRGDLLSAAREHLGTVMAGYTHGQQTHPITLGHMFVGYADALARDFDRTHDAVGRIDRCPAGAAIMAGTSVRIDRRRLSELLGFLGLAENTFDAVLSQDALLEALWIVAITSADVARLAEDLMILSSTEIAIASVPDRYSGTSSIAVHKRNPYAPQIMKGAGAQAVGSLMTAFTIEKGPTGMAMQDRAYSLQAAWSGLDDLERDLRWAGDIVAHLTVDDVQAEALANRYWATSTDVATMLVEEVGMPWRQAHQVVGVFVRGLQQRHVTPSEAKAADLEAATREVSGIAVTIAQGTLNAVLDARSFVERRTLVGGPAASEVTRQIDDRLREIERDASVLAATQLRMREADIALDGAVNELTLGTSLATS